MRRLAIWAVAGIAVLLVGAVAFILLLGDGGSPPAAPAPVPEPPPVDGGPPAGRSAAGFPLPPSGPGAPPLAAAIEYGPAPSKPPEGSWEAVAPVARAGSLGPVGVAIAQDLAELKPNLDECFSAASQARNAGQAVTAVKDEVVAEDNGATTLMLQVEGSAGELRIVDAPVEMRGSASDGLIACAQRVLRGRVIPSGAARAGTRFRIPFPLTP
jgi:hypothetical protein